MGAPVSEIKAGEAQSAESLLDSFKSIAAAERRRHATVLNYWLSIKGDKDVAPIRDLDPLEISDAGPHSLLLELIGGGEDAEVKHSGEALKDHVLADRVGAAPSPSLLSCIGGKLAIVGISRNFLAFEDEFSTPAGTARCWITLLPFSSTGVWVDYVYALVSVEGENVAEEAAEKPAVEGLSEEESTEVPAIVAEEEAPAPVEEPADAAVVEAEPEAETALEAEPEAEPALETEPEAEPVAEAELEPVAETEPEPDMEAEPEAVSEKRPGFSKIFEALAGFHGTNIRAEPVLPPVGQEEMAEPDPDIEPEQAVEAEMVEAPEPQAEDILELESAEPVEPMESVTEDIADDLVEEPAVSEMPAPVPSQSVEGPLQSKLEEVRAKADEARLAKLRSNLALYEGLSAAYDFALDAEGSPEEYLRLVEAQGLKIQLRSPMTPVVKLAFDGLCDESTIGQLEAVLAWALKQDLPRGTLAEKIESAGGIGPILNGQAAA